MRTLATEQEVLRFLLKQVARTGTPVMATHAAYYAGLTLADTVAERGYIDNKRFDWERVLGESYFGVSPDPDPKEPISSELHELIYELAIWFAGHQPYARLSRPELIEFVLAHVNLAVSRSDSPGGFRLTLSKEDGRGVGVKFNVRFSAHYRWTD